MTLLQEVPTTAIGAMAQWSKAFSTRYLFSAGVDFRHVDGASHEQGLDAVHGHSPSRCCASRAARSISSGAFVQGQVWPHPKLSVTLSARVDHWQNYNGRNLETDGRDRAADRQPAARCPTRATRSFSPRAAVLYRVSDTVSAFGSFGSGFRAPTLNELYRQFRVGAILTLANDQLGPERLIGGELGISVAPIEGLTFRTTLVRQPRREPGVQRHGDRSHRRRPLDACAVQARPASSGRTSGARASRGWQNDVEYRIDARLARRRRLSVQLGEGEGVRGEPGAGRHVPAAGAEASRLGQRGLLESAHRHRVGLGVLLRPAVQRRPERRAPSRARPSRACRPTAPWSSARCARLGATSTCSSACRTCSTRSTTSASRRRPSARRASSTAAFASAGRAASHGDGRRAPFAVRDRCRAAPSRAACAAHADAGGAGAVRRWTRSSIAPSPTWTSSSAASARWSPKSATSRASRSARRSAPRSAGRSSTRVVLVSDFLLVQVPGEGWMPFRDVFERNGQKVRDREERLAKLFLNGSSRSSVDQARQIMVESARYNIGTVERTINLPTLPLALSHPGAPRPLHVRAGQARRRRTARSSSSAKCGAPTYIATTRRPRPAGLRAVLGGRSRPARSAAPSSTPWTPPSKPTSR